MKDKNNGGQITGTDGADYVFGGLTGGSDQLSGLGGDDRLEGGFRSSGQAANDAGIDADLLTGGAGRDVFEARFWYEEGGFSGYGSSKLLGPHSDIVTDFTKGEDRLDLSFEWHNSRDYLASGGFRFVDTNGNGVVDGGDTYASLQQVTVGGVTKSSLVLDLAGAEAAAGQFHGVSIEPVAHTLTLFGVTSLTSADFVPEKVYVGLRAGSGDDTLVGDGSAQALFGNAGNDTLDGGGGEDILAGGAGTDVFRVRQAGSVTVADFARGEPRRVYRRLQLLRGWSDEQANEVLTGGAGAGRSHGGRAPGRARLGVGCNWLDRGEDRLHGGDAAGLGSAGGT